MRRAIHLLAAIALGAWAVAGEPPGGKELTNSLGMKLVRIEPGEFLMGCGTQPPRTEAEWKQRDWDEAPAHKVKITKPFHMAVHEVTNKQYEQFDPKHKELRGKFGAYGQGRVSTTDDEPVTMVSWHDAVRFCEWLSKKEGKPYRLPTEAEWEFACRAGTTTVYNTGDTLTPEQANIGLARDGKKKVPTVPVGSYPPNAWGLCDMHGNVEEWCLDWFGPYEPGERADPTGRADGFAKVTRGGSHSIASWSPDNARYCRSSNRSGHLPDDANRCTGFRIVLGEMPATPPLPAAKPPLHERDVQQTAAPREGPDPSKPYFVNFAAEKRNPTIPKDTWGPIFSAHNHFTALCACPNGDVLAAWYTTKSESGRELALAGSRLRVGADRWEPASLFFDVPDVNDHAPVLLCDGKRIWHFSSQALAGWNDTSILMRTSDDSGATWSKPRIILPRHDPDHLSQSCSAFVGPDGLLGLAVDGSGHGRERLMTSRDGGQTWRVGKGDMKGIHPAAVLLDGGSVIAFTRGPNPMPMFTSSDFGDTWQAGVTAFPGINVGQKAAALKLAGGAVLLCSHDTKKAVVGGGVFAALSLDGARTWPHVRKVEGVGGYMSVAQAPNGVIYLFGSRMGCVAFDEAWLREGKPLAPEAAGDDTKGKVR
ncbi:MAG TPA: SUMF1/EgtB/PvdO family nonheme iron enzyme [Planctomycetota bacterium]|nr:SUMF1/EgtB/PvdO family nonheme iron enzyme [Planctomycetota bacterium]